MNLRSTKLLRSHAKRWPEEGFRSGTLGSAPSVSVGDEYPCPRVGELRLYERQCGPAPELRPLGKAAMPAAAGAKARQKGRPCESLERNVAPMCDRRLRGKAALTGMTPVRCFMWRPGGHCRLRAARGSAQSSLWTSLPDFTLKHTAPR